MYNTTDYCLENEIWKDIPCYEGIYQASSLGRIRTVNNKVTYSIRHGIRHWKGKILKPKMQNDYKTGYRVSLWKNKTYRDWLVARLVAITFLGKSNLTVNHKDGNRLNNNIENLEWLSLGDNIRHGFNNGLYPSRSVKLKHNNKVFEFYSLAAASRFLNRNNGYVSLCLQRNKLPTDRNNNKYQYSLEIHNA